MGTRPAVEALFQHVEHFNHGVRSGNFTRMVEGFAPDGVIEFEGLAREPLIGTAAIADAYGSNPPDDEIDLLETVERSDGTVVASYAWKSEASSIAGEMRLRVEGDLIVSLVVTFGTHSPDVTPN